MQSDEQQIRALVSNWLAASRAGHMDTVFSLVADDVVFLVPGRPPMYKEEFAALSRVPPGMTPPKIDATSDIQEIQVSGDWAFMWTQLTVSVTPPDGGQATERAGHTLTVMKRVNGKWLLARDANLLVPVRGPSASPELERYTEALRATLKSQYRAALAMLRESVELCSDDLWFSKEHENACWQLAYHALFFAHAYLQPVIAAFRPWQHHQSNVQHEDGIAGPADPNSSLPLLPTPYTKAEVLEYWNFCDQLVDAAVDALDLHSTESGFPRYKIPKLEHQIVNIRHIEHHMAQIADRLRFSANLGVRWVGGSPCDAINPGRITRG